MFDGEYKILNFSAHNYFWYSVTSASQGQNISLAILFSDKFNDKCVVTLHMLLRLCFTFTQPQSITLTKFTTEISAQHSKSHF